VLSSLQPANVRLRRAIRDLDAAQRLPLYPLLFDPQTAGDLLAGVPAANAGACIVALRAEGTLKPPSSAKCCRLQTRWSRWCTVQKVGAN